VVLTCTGSFLSRLPGDLIDEKSREEKPVEELNENAEVEATAMKDEASIFIFNLETFDALKDVLSVEIPRLPMVAHPTMAERVNAQFRLR
jgi:hypothetical protein